jgi:hypothetical protein
MMTIWNFLTALYVNMKDKCQNMYYYLKDYFHGHHDMWLFVPGHTFPLSLSNLNNIINVNWLYDNYDNTLTLSTTNNEDPVKCKFSWLSAKIQVVDPDKPDEAIEYEIDDFVEKFTVCTKSTIPPSLYIIFMCWCAHTKHWFKMEDNIEFCVIDDMGDEHCLNIHDDNNSIVIKRNKLYVVIHTGDDDNTALENAIIEPPTENTPLKGEQDKKDE